MQTMKFVVIVSLIMLGFTGCRRNSNAVWEDTKSAGRHVDRGFRTLGGKHGDSRQVRSRAEFMGALDEECQPYVNDDFVALSDDPNCGDLAMADMVNRPPNVTPGDPGSGLPGIEAFQDPSTNARLAPIFRNITFGYNSTLVKGEENLTIVRNAGDYMRRYPNTYVFVEGHCDERGTEAYNLALGSNRANAVRNLLINEGVSPDNIFTISYGRERPIIQGHDEESWTQNRRAEFKVYER